MFSRLNILLTIAFLLCAVPAWAVPVKVQCLANGTQVSCGSGTTCTKAFGAALTVGNAVLLDGTPYDSLGGQLTSISDDGATGGNTYAIDENPIFTGGMYANIVSKFMAHGKVTKAATNLTLHFPNSTAVSFNACEWTWPDISVFDVDHHGNFVSGSSNSHCAVTLSGANTNANVFAYFGNFGAQGQSVPATYTDLWEDSAVIGNQTDYKIVSGSETTSADGAIAANTEALCVLATYNATPSASTVRPQGTKIGVLP